MSDYLLAHDLGTTGDKATLFDAEGRLLASAFAPYAVHYPRPGWAEQDPNDWWNAVCLSTRRLLAERPEAGKRLAAVGFSAMMNGCLLTDARGEPLRPGLIHADLRSAPQCARIAQEAGDERAYQITGNRLAPYFTLGKLAWLADNEPEILSRARWCLQTKDYLAGRLTDIWGVTDRSDASLTGCFDLERGVWSEELIAAASFDRRLLPDVRPSLAVIGTVTEAASEATGLPAGLPVVLGGGDGACATAGAGAVQPGDAYHYLGGTSWVAAVTQGYRPDPSRRVSVFCALEPGQYVVYGTVQTASGAVSWFREAIGIGKQQADEDEFMAMERLAASAPPGSNGLFFLPYLMGERSPLWDANARGVYFGLSAAHGRSELARAVFEGVAFALRSNMAVLEELGLAPEVIRVLGGGMRSPVWRSILAAVYNRPLRLLERLSEATSAGAAMAAAVGIGFYPNIASAAPFFAPLAGEEAPDPGLVSVYSSTFPLFQSLYPALADCFAALASLREDSGPETPSMPARPERS